MIQRCKTCRYWDKPDLHRPDKAEAHGTCTHPKLSEPMGAVKGDDTLIYSYDEGGGFSTGPNFGCVHHEPKE